MLLCVHSHNHPNIHPPNIHPPNIFPSCISSLRGCKGERTQPSPKSSESRGRAGIKGVFPTNTSTQTAFSCFCTNSRAALAADVVGGPGGDHRLRHDTFQCQDLCSWHRCLDARRRFGCQLCLGGPFGSGFCSRAYSAS